MYKCYALDGKMSSICNGRDPFPNVELCDMGILHVSQLQNFYVPHECDAIFALVLKQCLSTCSINNTWHFTKIRKCIFPRL